MNTVFLLLGSNLDQRELMLVQALNAIRQELGNIIRVSSVYESEPWGFTTTEHFLNQAIHIETPYSSEKVLEKLLMIEKRLGRTRNGNGYHSRTIYIDILLFNDEIIDRDCLQVPHPQMPFRKFALFPLSEIAGNQVHPALKKTIGDLLLDCPDPLSVKLLQAT
jgi:2-amino-4-hydroxy-6-hydroxymethyldihydropteridine diphosphokinase